LIVEKKKMIICKICNPTLEGNGYCAEHSTSGTSYLIMNNKDNIWERLKKEFGIHFKDSPDELQFLEEFIKEEILNILEDLLKQGHEGGNFRRLINQQITKIKEYE